MCQCCYLVHLQFWNARNNADPARWHLPAKRKFAAAAFNPAQMCGAQSQMIGAQSQDWVQLVG
jgi:hypothetical protein